MIIAWGLFILSLVGMFIGGFAFYGSIKKEYFWSGKDTLQLILLFLIGICSAQYIWG